MTKHHSENSPSGARRPEQERQRRRLEAVGRRAGRVAHDLKNLLLVVDGLTGLLLRRTDDRSTRRDLEGIHRAVEQAEELSRQLLAVAHERTATRPRPVHPNAVLRGLDRVLRRLVGGKVVLHLDLMEGLGRIWVDPAQLEQAVLNLVLNARDAMPQGGEILVATARVELESGTSETLRPGRYLALRVSDDGAGMDEETRAHLFEPFFTTKSGARGTGLGLWLVHAFVTRAGGEIRIRSEVGVGTTVELLLPEVDPPKPRSRSSSEKDVGLLDPLRRAAGGPRRPARAGRDAHPS
jgi:signal transduction histidine kinase